MSLELYTTTEEQSFDICRQWAWWTNKFRYFNAKQYFTYGPWRLPLLCCGIYPYCQQRVQGSLNTRLAILCLHQLYVHCAKNPLLKIRLTQQISFFISFLQCFFCPGSRVQSHFAWTCFYAARHYISIFVFHIIYQFQYDRESSICFTIINHPHDENFNVLFFSLCCQQSIKKWQQECIFPVWESCSDIV